MAPTAVRLRFTSAQGTSSAVIEAPMDESQVALPPAETLSMTGTSLGTLRLTVRAHDYGYVGASLLLGNAGGWFVYSQDAQDMDDMPWPELPTGMTVGDLVADAGATMAMGEINAFAVKKPDGARPWNWHRSHLEQAILRTQPVALTGR